MPRSDKTKSKIRRQPNKVLSPEMGDEGPLPELSLALLVSLHSLGERTAGFTTALSSVAKC